jgi:hypothetical protein
MKGEKALKTIIFTYSRGWNDVIEEEFEYEEDVTEEEIQKDFEEWVWNEIGDLFNWHEK